MRIKTLRMKAFGKFKDKTIELSPGLNLIQGNNEAGKTTTQAFMQGMFFGFYKPYRKKKTYSKEYEKYLPWNQFDYSGALVYEIEGREIRLERNFLRGKDSLQIYDNKTGEEITGEFQYDGVTRQNEPLGGLGISQVVYNTTVNSRQHFGEFENSSKEELKECFGKIKNKNSGEVDFTGITRRLEEKKKNIGRSGQSKSPIGVAIRAREKLLLSLKESEVAFATISKNQETIEALKGKMAQIEIDHENLAFENALSRKKELLENHKKIEVLEKENDRLRFRIREWKGLEVFNSEALEGLKTIQNQIEQLSYQIKYIDEEMNDIETQLRNIRQQEEARRIALGKISWETILEDHEIYYIHKKKMEAPKEKQKSKGVWIVSTVFLLVGLIFLGNQVLFSSAIKQSVSDMLFTFGGVIVLSSIVGLGFAASVSLRNNSGRGRDLLDETQHSVLLKYGKETPEEYEDFFIRARKIQNDLEQLKNEGELLTVQQSRRRAGYEVLFEQRRGIIRTRQERLMSYGVNSLEAYETGLKKNNDLQEMKNRLANNEKLLESLYENVKVEIGIEEHLKQMSAPHTDELLRLGKEIARLEGENNTLLKGVSLPVEIKESIKSLEAQIMDNELNIKACDEALKIIQKIQKGKHYESAPELNGIVGKALGEITQKYNEVKIGEGLEVKVVDPLEGNLKKTSQLSAGTIDQVEFAFRYGISGVMDNPMPFILDEPFVRYDYERKSQALVLLGKLSHFKQIILFTCNNEDGQILEDFGYALKKINL
ncbi:MAG: ATP-binding protein [Eubacteriaceae bacterium]